MNLKDRLLNQVKTNNLNIINDDQIQNIVQKTFLWTWWISFLVFVIWYYIVSLINTHSISAWNYSIAFWSSFVLWLVLIFTITWGYSKMKYSTLSILAILFSIVEGIWIAGILSIYDSVSIINAFIGAAVLFIMLAIYGYTTKTDLTKMGTLLFVWLITIIIFSLLNILLIHSSQFDMIISIIALIIFLGLTAWDLQTLKLMAQTGDKRLEIVFWISLYLNFINIFLELLKIFGNKNE